MKTLISLAAGVLLTLSAWVFRGLPYRIVAAPAHFLFWSIGRFTSGPTVVNLFTIEGWDRVAVVFNTVVWGAGAYLVLLTQRLIQHGKGDEESAA